VSRVRENRTHGSTGGRWKRTRPAHGADKVRGKPERDETPHLPAGTAPRQRPTQPTSPGLSVARKLARRIRFTLAELGDDALAPVDDSQLPELSGACRSEALSAVA
jgi:hypothetical protein